MKQVGDMQRITTGGDSSEFLCAARVWSPWSGKRLWVGNWSWIAQTSQILETKQGGLMLIFLFF